MKKINPGQYQTTTATGTVYEVSQNECDTEWKCYIVEQGLYRAELVWCETFDTLRDARAWIAANDQTMATIAAARKMHEASYT